MTATEAINYGRTAVFDGVFGPGLRYIPESIAFRDVTYDRQRLGRHAAAHDLGRARGQDVIDRHPRRGAGVPSFS